MWCTDVLREEHRWILRMLQCLERVCLDCEQKGRLEAEGTAELMALFTHFADGLHQEREERFLFPRILARARCVNERTDVGRLCGEHEQERQALARMTQELLGAIYGEARSLRGFLMAARRFIELQREHLLHENRELLPLADQLLTAEDDQAVLSGFASLEDLGLGDPKRILRRIENLSVQLGVVPPPDPLPTP